MCVLLARRVMFVSPSALLAGVHGLVGGLAGEVRVCQDLVAVDLPQVCASLSRVRGGCSPTGPP